MIIVEINCVEGKNYRKNKLKFFEVKKIEYI